MILCVSAVFFNRAVLCMCLAIFGMSEIQDLVLDKNIVCVGSKEITTHNSSSPYISTHHRIIQFLGIIHTRQGHHSICEVSVRPNVLEQQLTWKPHKITGIHEEQASWLHIPDPFWGHIQILKSLKRFKTFWLKENSANWLWVNSALTKSNLQGSTTPLNKH